MLTRVEFDAACKALINKYANNTETSIVTTPLVGWSWNEHPTYPNFGYMARTVHVRRRPLPTSVPELDDFVEEPSFDEPDPSTLAVDLETQELLTSQQYVVFSPTFKVPTFYFTVCNASGAPLPLSEIVKTSLFKANACEGVEISSFALSLPTSTFPLLSFGEHPTLETSCWYFHPCETNKAVEELMFEVQPDYRDDLVRWFELWFMILGTVVNL